MKNDTVPIPTASGLLFDPLKPTPDGIRAVDVAHALANKCRYTGHTRVFYSVAEHSVRVSQYLREGGVCREGQLWGLLHDCGEAYLPDIASPVKPHVWIRIPGTGTDIPFEEAERNVLRAVAEALTVPWEGHDRWAATVKEADLAILSWEVRALLPPIPGYWREADRTLNRSPPAAPELSGAPGWKPRVARDEFLVSLGSLLG